MRLLLYSIEVRNPVVGHWEVKKLVRPKTSTIGRRVLLGWVDDPYVQIKDAEDCRERAMLWAFEIYQGPADSVRVRETQIHQDATEYSFTIWEDGQWGTN